MEVEHVVVDTRLGQIRGLAKQSIFSPRVYYLFQGIPFGKPPLGKLRFKAPEPFGDWEGVRDATKEGNHCCQFTPEFLLQGEQNQTELSFGNEDCLYLNISINKLPQESTSRRPVMVFFHGGGFEAGSGSPTICGPDFFMEEDVVLVTTNYRCGPFGFLSLENEEVPGNAGLRDQTLALQWIHDNIDSFGGDLDNVTIFGTSAGGASVQYHLLSPLSAGLFHKAVVQSGSALNPWALQLEPRTTATQLAATLGCVFTEPHEVLTFLQSVPASDLLTAKKTMVASKVFSIPLDIMFTPCVETVGLKPFLPDSPQKLMEEGRFNRVPVILGTVMQEGSVVPACNQLTDDQMKKQNENPTCFVTAMLRAGPGSAEEMEVRQAISQFYFKGETVSWNNVGEFITFLGDVIVNIGMQQSRDILVKKNNCAVYRYLFTNHRQCICSILKTKMDAQLFSKIFSGSCHSSEFIYMFSLNLTDTIKTPLLTSEDRKDIKKLVKAWTSFATAGDPNHEGMEATWDTDTVDNPCYMDLGGCWCLREGVPFEDRMKFWEELRSKHLIV